MKYHYLALISCLLSCVALHAQEKTLPNEDRQINAYLKAVGNHTIIYTGKEETKYPTYVLNHPYLDTKEFREGRLSFDGIIYPHVKMRLNLHKDELVVFSPDNRFSVILPSDRVDFATIDSLYIIYSRPEKDSLNLPEGYHVRLYNGTYEVWKRETMFLESTIKDMLVELSFSRKRRFYIRKDGTFHPVSSKKTVLKLFETTKQKELKKYIKQHRLNFKKVPDEAIVSVVNYYETLSR